jgi:hypothetical protein
MKNISILFIFLLFALAVTAQNRYWQWAKTVPQPDNAHTASDVRSVTTDAQGNVIATGYFYSDSMTFGTYVIHNAGTPGSTENIYTVKYDASGNVLWARGGGGAREDFPAGVRTDRSGNIYVAGGFFSDSISFDGHVLYNFGPTDTTCDGYVVKYDPNGNYLWGRTFGGNYYDGCDGLTTDAWGNVYLAGYFQSDSITIGSYKLYNSTTIHDHNGLLIKYDGAGNLKWVTASVCIGGGVEEYGVACDAAGHATVAGRFAATASFGSQTVQSPGENDIMIVQYDSMGNALWAQQAGGPFNDEPNAIATDASGNILVTGYFDSPNADFSGLLVANDTTNESADIFLAKYDVSGNMLWAKGYGGSQNEIGFALTTDTGDNVYITGYYLSPMLVIGQDTLINSDQSGATDDIYVAGFDPSGNVLSAISAGGLSYDGGYGITADAANNIYVGGFFRSDQVSFGSTTLDNSTNTHNVEPFVARYSQLITGIHDIGSLPSITLYPNPANNILMAQSDFFASHATGAEVYDMQGNKVKAMYDVSGDKLIFDTGQLSAGMYVIKFVSGDIESRAKFIKTASEY